ncbi:two-component response regulator-like protein [Rhizophagus irregularis]|uniref:Two-component response regulator-like protein n=1 Tax=Rhizophagus irregularis TaxID=588596 RepID=A0A2N0QIP2_9GLOM|nr:two-component response regulator-like protein [Rhizophagus irregularis]
MIRVLIADDHHIVRRGLIVFLKTQKDIEVVGEAKNGLEAIELVESLMPDVVLMDLVGAAGYQLKDIEPDDLVTAIRKIMLGESIMHPVATTQLEESIREEESLPHIKNPLTPRERDVLAELTKGKSNREIASSLFVTEKTVKTHISNIFNKLQVQDRTQAALYAVKHNLTEGSGLQ